jgi:hypothetical protein
LRACLPQGKSPTRIWILAKVGMQIYFCWSANPQIPQILGLIMQSQIRKFLRFASLQIANPRIAKNIQYVPQIANRQITTFAEGQEI